MSKFWSRIAGDLKPYTPGEQPKLAGLVKLNTNENPFGPAPGVAQAIGSCSVENLRLYPDPDAVALREALAHEHGVAIDNIFVGNGSDEVLAHIFCALLKQDLPILMPDISYGFYRAYCLLYNVAHIDIPLDAEFRINVRDYARPCGGVILANPNAPTGIAISIADIEYLLTLHAQRVVVIDEAYVDFGCDSAVSLLARCPNLLVVRTFSKSRGLAGIRVGYALGSAELITGLNRVKNSFNSYPLSTLSMAAALASLSDEKYFLNSNAEIIRLRQFVSAGLERLGLTILPSLANFVFAAHPTHPAATLMAGLRQRGVLVRHFGNARIENYLRISIGSESDCLALLRATQQVLDEVTQEPAL